MKTYINTKTGATFSSACLVSGGDWVLKEKNEQSKQNNVYEQDHNTDEQVEPVNNEELAEKDTEEMTDNDTEEITKKDIMQELDAFGVEYNPRDKKQKLYELMMANGK